MHSFESSFHKLLTRRLAHARESKAKELVGGSGILDRDSADATGIRYAKYVGYFEALGDFEAWCEEVFEDLMKD